MNHPRLGLMPENFFVTLNDDTAHLFIAVSLIRPELYPFIQALEDGFYPPGTPENDKFLLFLFAWEGIKYAVVGIPLKDRWVAERVAEQTRTRLADGYPHLMDRGAVKRFPLRSRRTFTLEVRHERKGPVVGDVVDMDPAGNARRSPVTEAAKKAVNEFLRGKRS